MSGVFRVEVSDDVLRMLERQTGPTDEDVFWFFTIEGPKIWHQIREQMGCPHDPEALAHHKKVMARLVELPGELGEL